MQDKYKTHVQPKFELIKGWARDGLTDKQIAQNLCISYSTFRQYRDSHSALSAILKENKEYADYAVENALYKSAIEGNTTAQIFWLKNRKPKQWRDKPEERCADGGDALTSAIIKAAERSDDK